VLCWLTPAGTELVGRIDGPMDAADDSALAMLSSEDQVHLIRLLDAIRAAHPGTH
jgi:DNA-binding MarR family transcriptional regulator